MKTGDALTSRVELDVVRPVAVSTVLAAAALALALSRLVWHPAEFPPPKTLGPVETYGANVQRAMTLLATSTPEKRNTVRLLFYGQSISQQDWTKAVAADLRRRFPHADLVVENRAIDGFTAEFLARTAEADLYPFYPDLVVFHVYGLPQPYETIIRRLRERTTADILHTTDHLSPRLGNTSDEQTDPLKLTPADTFPWMNHVFLPDLSRRYGTELADVRGLWKRYLADHRLAAEALVHDGIHLSAHGNYLMGAIVSAHLRYRPDLSDTAWKDRVKTYTVGRDVVWKDGTLALPFDGNRVDVIRGPGTGPAATVRIDGKKPSAFPELYTVTRARTVPDTASPPLLCVQAATPRVIEEWTLTVTGVSADRLRFTFRVAGSVTGDDGAGDTGTRFVSKSGRVVIDANDFNLITALRQSEHPTGIGLQARWRVVPLFADEVGASGEGETAVTVAQGLPNGPHTLELAGGPDTPVAAIRVYRPTLSPR